MSEKTKAVLSGHVIWFDPRKGFGFIDQDNSEDDIFLHWSNISVEGFKTVKPNQRVSYEIGQNHRGVQAVNVTLHDTEDTEDDKGGE